MWAFLGGAWHRLSLRYTSHHSSTANPAQPDPTQPTCCAQPARKNHISVLGFCLGFGPYLKVLCRLSHFLFSHLSLSHSLSLSVAFATWFVVQSSCHIDAFACQRFRCWNIIEPEERGPVCQSVRLSAGHISWFFNKFNGQNRRPLCSLNFDEWQSAWVCGSAKGWSVAIAVKLNQRQLLFKERRRAWLQKT